VPLGLKGRVAAEELVGEHAQRPDVDGVVVVLVLDHLGGEVVEGPAEGRAARRGRVHGPAKVGDFDVALVAEEEVLGLDVAVDHVLPVAVVERLGDGADVLRATRGG
jgi:hypothetical protein